MNSNTNNSYPLMTEPILRRKSMQPLALAFTSIFASILGSNTPAQALSFNFTFSDNTPLEVRTVFWEAGDAWSKQLTDDAVINIYVEAGELPTNVLAGTRPAMTRVTYSEFLTKLSQDKSSQDPLKYISNDYDDASALSNLQSSTNFKYLRHKYNASNPLWSGDSEVVYGKTVWLTRANAKALNISNQNNSNDNEFDASIRISNTIPWHYDTNTPVSKSQYDLLTVAAHEIGHALGFVSGLDAFQLSTANSNWTWQNLEYITPMDLLRYSKKSIALGSIDWTADQTFFSLDGGRKNLGDLARGASVNGFQAGHWKYGPSQGIMDPFLKTGERWGIADLDRQLLDAIGWDYATQLSKNVVTAMQGINWNTSDPDLRMVENVLKAHLSVEMESLRQERDTIKDWDPKTWTELQKKADEEFQKQQQEIQKTLTQIRNNKYDPGRRVEEALKGTTKQLETLAKLAEFHGEKLRGPMTAEISDALNGSSKDIKNQLKTATRWQLQALVAKVRNTDQNQQNKWRSDIKEALRQLYLEEHHNQNPSEIELNAELEKLLNTAAPDEGLGWGGSRRYWQTGGTKKPKFEKIGEFTFHSVAAPETASSFKPVGIMGMLGLGLLSIGFLLKQYGKRSSRHNPSMD